MRNSVKTVSGAFIPALAAFVGSTVPAMAHPGMATARLSFPASSIP
jgi:hypothetical protein